MVFTNALSCKAINENYNFKEAILVLDDSVLLYYLT